MEDLVKLTNEEDSIKGKFFLIFLIKSYIKKEYISKEQGKKFLDKIDLMNYEEFIKLWNNEISPLVFMRGAEFLVSYRSEGIISIFENL